MKWIVTKQDSIDVYYTFLHIFGPQGEAAAAALLSCAPGNETLSVEERMPIHAHNSPVYTSVCVYVRAEARLLI